MQTIGTVQSYLQLNQLGGYSTGDVGWITGIHLFLSYCFTIQIGPICDHDGPMVVGPIGVAITIISFLLAAECKVYWQFMLCFGVLVALGGAITATSAMSAIAKLFVRRRGLAIGLTLTGSTTGSIIFPMMLRSTLPALGWQWSMRLLAFVIAGLTIPGLFCFLPYRRLVARLPDQQRLLKRSEAVLDFSAFRSPSFTFICAGSFLLEFAIYGIAGLLPSIAISSGLNSEDGYTLITVLSACSFFGRALPGLMADFFGPFNVLLAINAFTIVCMATLFIPFAGKSRALLYAFAGLWGFGSGCFFAMPLGSSCRPRQHRQAKCWHAHDTMADDIFPGAVCMGRTCTAKNYGRFYGENNEHSLGWTCTLPGFFFFSPFPLSLAWGLMPS